MMGPAIMRQSSRTLMPARTLTGSSGRLCGSGHLGVSVSKLSTDHGGRLAFDFPYIVSVHDSFNPFLNLIPRYLERTCGVFKNSSCL